MKHSKKIALVLLGTVSLTALSACKEEKSESVETVVGNPAITSSQTPTQTTVKNQEQKNIPAVNPPVTTELEEPAIPSPVQAPPTTTQSSSSNSSGLLPAFYGFLLGRATSNIGSSNNLPHIQPSTTDKERIQHSPIIIPNATSSYATAPQAITPQSTTPAPTVSSPSRGGIGSTSNTMSAGG